MKFNNISKGLSVGMKPEPISEQFIEFDSKMQKGYQYLLNQEYNKAIEIWVCVWNELMNFMETNNIETFKRFDEIYNGTQFVTNWVNDYEECLHNIVANSNDAEVLEVYGNMRIQLNEQIQNFTDAEEELTLENAKRAIAETYFFLGDIKKGEELFEKYLSENPRWGWGWIGWSDQYWLYKREKVNFIKGEELLLKALTVQGLNDRDDVEGRLLGLYSESEQDEKLNSLEKKLNQCKKDNYVSEMASNENNINITSKKIGRNVQCPCGSGKKYKKCCGR